MNHRVEFLQIFQRDVAQNAVPAAGSAPGRNDFFAHSAAVGQHAGPSGAAGVKPTSGRRIQGAGHIAAEADFFLRGIGLGMGTADSRASV
jgi:hypothetical protein